VKEERLQVLKMIQEGIITPEEGARLLAAMGDRTPTPPKPPKAPEAPVRERPVYNPRWLRIKISDKRNESTKVNITIPLPLLDWGLRIAEESAGVNLSAVREVIRNGAEGKIIEVEDSASEGRVEISVE
jgi:hypothetical protein